MDLDAATLGKLRAIVRDLATGTSLGELVQATGALSLGSGLTVDFEASRDLGQPLVVIRPVTHAALDGLTPREREIATLIADGLSNKQIAARLGLTVGTVKHYVHQILDKTGLASRVSIATRQSLGG